MKLLLLTVAIAFGILIIRAVHVDLTHIETADNVPTVDWLPDSASNISYYRSCMFTAYEFGMTESEFLKWSRWDVAEITEPAIVTRYTRFSKEISNPEANATVNELEAFVTAWAEQSARIDDGLYYGYVQDNGGGVWVGYDRNKGRVFYQSAPR